MLIAMDEFKESLTLQLSPRVETSQEMVVAVSSVKHRQKLAKKEEKYRIRLEKEEERLRKKETKRDGKSLKKRQKRIEKEKRETLKKQAAQFLEAQKFLDLLLSGERRKIEKKLKHTKSLNILTREGKSVVNCVLDNNNVEVLQLLVASKKIDLAFSDQEKNTPFHALLRREDWQIVHEWSTMFAILIECLNGKGIEDENPFESLGEEEEKRRSSIINAQDKIGWTPFHWAVRQNNFGAVPILYANGANVDANLFNDLDTPLEVAYSDEMKKALEKLKATPRQKITTRPKMPQEIKPKKSSSKSSSIGQRPTSNKTSSPVRPIRKKRPDDSFNTMRLNNWNNSLKIPNQQKRPENSTSISSSITIPQPQFSPDRFNYGKRKSKSASGIRRPKPASPSDLYIKFAMEGLHERPKSQTKQQNQNSTSLPDLPKPAFVLVPRRTKRSFSAHRTEAEIKKELANLPPPCLDDLQLPPKQTRSKPSPQRSYSVCFTQRPPTPNYETKPQTSQSFSHLPALSGKSISLQKE